MLPSTVGLTAIIKPCWKGFPVIAYLTSLSMTKRKQVITDYQRNTPASKKC